MDLITDSRKSLLAALIVQAEQAMGRVNTSSADLAVLVRSWEYALEDIPTKHLETCFRRALKAKTDTFPFSAPEVNNQWEALKQELIREGEQVKLTMLPEGKSDYMTIGEFKARHNLPLDWITGDPYPEESDLYQQAPPPKPDELKLYNCYRCKDVGWTRIPYSQEHPWVERIKCICEQAGLRFHSGQA